MSGISVPVRLEPSQAWVLAFDTLTDMPLEIINPIRDLRDEPDFPAGSKPPAVPGLWIDGRHARSRVIHSVQSDLCFLDACNDAPKFYKLTDIEALVTPTTKPIDRLVYTHQCVMNAYAFESKSPPDPSIPTSPGCTWTRGYHRAPLLSLRFAITSAYAAGSHSTPNDLRAVCAPNRSVTLHICTSVIGLWQGTAKPAETSTCTCSALSVLVLMCVVKQRVHSMYPRPCVCVGFAAG